MKLIIAGSRTFTDYQLLCQTLALERSRITQVGSVLKVEMDCE